MIVPSSLMAAWLAMWLARTLGVHALGAVGALILVAGAIMAVTEAAAGLAAIGAGTGLLSIGWGLTDPQRPAIAVTTPPTSYPAIPMSPGEPSQPAWHPGVVGEAQAA